MSGREDSSPMARLPLRTREGHLHAVIEASAGSRNKFKFDPRLGVFVLHSVLPLGTSFPYDFGFLPSTCGEDGDRQRPVLGGATEPQHPALKLRSPRHSPGTLQVLRTEVRPTRRASVSQGRRGTGLPIRPGVNVGTAEWSRASA